MTDVIYRQAEADDEPQILRLQEERRHTESDYPQEHLLKRWIQAGELWIAADADRIVGWFALEHTFYEDGFVHALWVAPSHRRLGIGSQLMRRARELCRTERLWTSTNLSNHPMQELLRNLGWKLSGVLHYLDPDDPEIVYVHLGDL